MTFLSLQQYVSDFVDDPNNSYFTLPLLKMRLNLALRETQKRLISANHQYYTVCVKTNTVIGQAAYSLPSDFLQIIRLERVTQGSGDTATVQKIYEITPNQRDNGVDDANSGDPYAYYFQKNNLILKPVPQRAVEMHLEYSYYVSDMVNDSDIPDAPQQFHEYIGILTARDCYLKDGRPTVPMESKLMQYEVLFKQIAQQRAADGPRMTVMTEDWY